MFNFHNLGSISTLRTSIKTWVQSDFFYRFVHSPIAVVSSSLILLCLSCALFAPWIAPFNPFDLSTLELSDARLPPIGMQGSDPKYLFGTDDQGRDILSALMFGSRISLLIGFISVLLSVIMGMSLGLISGYAGGKLDSFIMRICDVMLSFPAILLALLISGVGRALFPQQSDAVAFIVLILSISLSGWVQYARTVRSSTLVEREKEYVQAAQIAGVSAIRIMRLHVLPNVLGPVVVLATVQVATAIITEATLSFLGVGAPPTSPSLGTLIRVGNDYLFSGEWWISIFPGLMLVLISVSINLFGDWLRDALNPRLN